ncbi:MAG: PKD domain-containing protein [Bacteroidota bacterium]
MKTFKQSTPSWLLTMMLLVTFSHLFAQKVVNGRLVFQDRASFEATYNKLSAQVAAYVDVRPDVQEGQPFEPSPTLAAFESTMPGFTSLRKLELDDEGAQLSKGISPSELVDYTWVSDEIAASLINGKYVVQVADTIFYLRSKNLTVKILNANERVLSSVLAGEPLSNYASFIIVDDRGGSDCTADFDFSTSYLTSNSGSFTFTGFTPATGTIYKWDFGDGTPFSYQKNPSHTYASQGVYHVVLTIETRDGLCYSVTSKVIPVNQGCIALFKYNTTGAPGGICFNDNSTTINGTIIKREWSFGDGSPNVVNQMNPCHTFPCDKDYNVTLTITTSTGCSRSMTHKVKISSYACCDKDIDENETRFTMEVEPGKRMIAGSSEDFQLLGIFSNVNADLRHYKKGLFGVWWRHKADLKVEIIGRVYTEDQNDCICKNPYNVDCSDACFCRSVKAKKHVSKKFRTNREDPWIAKFYEGGILRKTIIAPITCS